MSQPVDGAPSGPGTEGQSAPGATDGSAGTGTGATGQSAQQAGTENTVSRAEFDQLRAQLSAADQKRTKAEADLKAMQDAALSEEEKRKRDLEAATVQLREKDETIKSLQMDLAFLKDNTYNWHNPEAALALADKSKITIGDDGKAQGLKEALEAVAKTHPYLLKPKEETPAPPAGLTGLAGQGTASGQGNAGRAGLEKKFPALRGRVS